MPLLVVVLTAAGSVSLAGIQLDRRHVFTWILLGLLSVSLRNVRGWTVGIFRDWLPLFGVLSVYAWLRGRAFSHVDAAHVTPPIQFDRWVLHGNVSTVWLQAHFFHADAPHWYDYAALVVYMSHFVTSFIVMGIVWKVSHARFVSFSRMFIVLSLLSFCTYALFPAMPPWLASAHGVLPPTTRVVHAMWQYVNVHAAADIFTTNSHDSNPVAAMPSLHSGYAMLLAAVFWRGSRWWVRAILLGYAFAMAATLMYAGEHYLLDILFGWIYAIGTFVGYSRFERRNRPGAVVRSVWSATRFGRRPALADETTST